MTDSDTKPDACDGYHDSEAGDFACSRCYAANCKHCGKPASGAIDATNAVCDVCEREDDSNAEAWADAAAMPRWPE